jgi:hypothetical protein
MTRARASFAGLIRRAGTDRAVSRLGPGRRGGRGARARQGWLEAGDEANWLLLFVAFGLAALQRERELEALDRADATALDRERQRLRRVHMRLDGRLSTLRFAAFELARTNRILEIRETALRVDNHGLRLRLGDGDGA